MGSDYTACFSVLGIFGNHDVINFGGFGMEFIIIFFFYVLHILLVWFDGK